MDLQDLKNWERDGYLILKNIISASDCKRFKKKIIDPILFKRKIIYKKKFKISGDLLIAEDGGDHPIGENNKYNRWCKIFESKKLIQALNQIHGSYKKWNWLHGAEKGLGWIHLRFPYSNNKKWIAPKSGWHLDGLSDDDQLNPNQSVIILPLITTINPGGGGTALLPGSHKLINDWILSPKKKDIFDKINHIVKQNKKKIIETNGKAGDILLLHPHLVHTASNALVNQPIRVTFNLDTQIVDRV